MSGPLSAGEMEYILSKVNGKTWGSKKTRTYKSTLKKKISAFDGYSTDMLLLALYADRMGDGYTHKTKLAESFFSLFYDRGEAKRKAKELYEDCVNQKWEEIQGEIRVIDKALNPSFSHIKGLTFGQRSLLIEELAKDSLSTTELAKNLSGRSRRKYDMSEAGVDRLYKRFENATWAIKDKRRRVVEILRFMKKGKHHPYPSLKLSENACGVTLNYATRVCNNMQKRGMLSNTRLGWKLTDDGLEVLRLAERMLEDTK